MNALWVLVAVAAGLLVLAPPLAGPGKRGPDRPAIVRAARAVETALAWPELAAFLDAAAFTESRWHPTAGAQRVGRNLAIGAWQIIPTSAFPARGARKEWTRAQSIAMGGRLLDPRVNAAAIGGYLARTIGRNPGASWEQLRAAMVSPVFIHGRPTGPAPKRLQDRWPTAEAWAGRYDESVQRFREALAASGVSLDPTAPAGRPPAVPFTSALAAEIGASLQ